MALERHEVQGALQALLATRLTDAPETDAAQAREAVLLALARGDESGSQQAGVVNERYAQRLSEYFDDRISALVGELEGRVGLAGLAQVRAEAYSSRILALLGAIERQVAALADARRRGVEESRFLERYRKQVQARHGYLVPPDFDRRRRVPIHHIYVPTAINEEANPEQSRLMTGSETLGLNVWNLAERLGRTVLLGDPGGGKTTATNVLADYFASEATHKVPFLITLRDYAAKTPPERSVVEYIEQVLNTLHQCPAPDGLVEQLLLTGRAVVIFDGLDELLDTTRRRDVSDRVEQFCSAYPLTPVLVTSRMVGYDQARLDDSQFSCYRLEGFGDVEVTEYAEKWFATEEGIAPAEAEVKAKVFLRESANAKDLLSNPLLLSLMCILYRGAGSLPGDRAGIYARCAELLLRKWDEQRDLYRKLRSDHLVEPTIRYLAWWLFKNEDSRMAVTEQELISKTSEFLHGRGFETVGEAQAAAKEFVRFCHGRMWVFSDVGTTANGEKLYAFTHRTFLEYFTAAHLAAVSDTPEDLARSLMPHTSASEWQIIGQLSIQIKNGNSDRGSDRVYRRLLDHPHSVPRQREFLLNFLATCLESARPSPNIVRTLTLNTLDLKRDDIASHVSKSISLGLLIDHSTHYQQLIADEISNRLDAIVKSANRTIRVDWLRLALEIGWDTQSGFWQRWSAEQADRYATEIGTEAADSAELRTLALNAGVISLEEAMEMPGGVSALVEDVPAILTGSLLGSYARSLYQRLTNEEKILSRGSLRELRVIGRHLLAHPNLPFVRASPLSAGWNWDLKSISIGNILLLDELSGLGLRAMIAISTELAEGLAIQRFRQSHLPIPSQFEGLFLHWAEGRANFVDFTSE